ncbi:LysM peptidoglycan-binding domain-containing protein [Hymenobacter sp. 5317J-9]|uniref:LysM peptidoglycan-binding domain-containing protein n=1 Tax=Hymenobacter sp. 5317J-9 TaxID=2932250 RepID=UPI001FD71CA8|nr:LysM peptidoglycan-binding domain-containing protein [Hymenobacter sp. 5317J-9]UOQ99309.1 LysM peptidoglycan-binding domain-containing protein [Hymenobacter sp. 5317J-9]
MTNTTLANALKAAISNGELDLVAFQAAQPVAALGAMLSLLYPDAAQAALRLALTAADIVLDGPNKLTVSGTTATGQGLYGSQDGQPAQLVFEGATGNADRATLTATLAGFKLSDLTDYGLVPADGTGLDLLGALEFGGVALAASSLANTLDLGTTTSENALSILSALNIELTELGFAFQRKVTGSAVDEPELKLVVSGLFATINTRLSIQLPVDGAAVANQWYLNFTSDPDKAPAISIGNIPFLPAGMNLASMLPASLAGLANFGLLRLGLIFDAKLKTITWLTVEVGVTQWQITSGFTIERVAVQLVVINPFGSTDRVVSPAIMGRFAFDDTGVNYLSVLLAPQGPYWEILLNANFELTGLSSVAKLPGGIDVKSLALPADFDSPTAVIELNTFRILFDPKAAKLQSLTLDVDVDFTWWLWDDKIGLANPAVFINKEPEGTVGSIHGSVIIGPVWFLLSAEKTDDAWVLSGGVAPDMPVKIVDLIEFLGLGVPQGWDLTVQELNLTVSIDSATSLKTFAFRMVLSKVLEIPELNFSIDEARLSLLKTPTLTSGAIGGRANVFGLDIDAEYTFGDPKDPNDGVLTFKLWGGTGSMKLKTPYVLTVTIPANLSLGQLLTFLINAVRPGEDITLPDPWSVLNQIKLGSFGFKIDFTNKTVSATLGLDVNLGFVAIQEVALTYSLTTKEVSFGISKGSFLGGAAPLPKPWNAADPSQAPAVPGQGSKVFDLQFLGMGQHVLPVGGPNTKSVADAIAQLRAAFKPDGQKVPPLPTTLEFSAGTNWLIGTQFTVVQMVDLSIVFYDPQLYGLLLSVTGGNFKNLKFEVLYKKVSDTVGVYQINLVLPDFIRNLDFGYVSVTLPGLKLWIYTDGGFKVDLGFPADNDFSQSFAIQALPFTGAGGFYFGVLQSESGQHVPVSSCGTFSPVIIFGLGLRLGIGKSIDKGILKAGLSLTVQGILEGTLAFYNPYSSVNPALLTAGACPAAQPNELYYYVTGNVAIVGTVYGSIDFAIISASLNITVTIGVRLVVETAKALLVTFYAGVSVALEVSINLGFFSIKISFSFKTTISESFRIGSDNPNPFWGKSSSRFGALRPKTTLLTRLDAPSHDYTLPIPIMNWQAPSTLPAEQLDLFFVPQYTVAGLESEGYTTKHPQCVAMLFVKNYLGPADPGGAKTSFTKLARGVLTWVFQAYFSEKPGHDPDILQQLVTLENLQEIGNYFAQTSASGAPEAPFGYADVQYFLKTYAPLVLSPPPGAGAAEEGLVTVFPMIPLLKLVSDDYSVDFGTGPLLADQAYLEGIRAYFRELAVQFENEAEQPDTGATALNEDQQTLATFMFTDYFALLAKQLVQYAEDDFRNAAVVVKAGDSLASLAREYAHYGLDTAELAYANRLRPLQTGRHLTIRGARHLVQHGEQLADIYGRFEGLHASAALGQAEPLPAGSTITLPPFQHRVAAGGPATLLHVARAYELPVEQLARDNADVADLFIAGRRLVFPMAEQMTVTEILDRLETGQRYEHLSGLASRVMLSGLRPESPVDSPFKGARASLFELSGQQFDATKLKLNEVVQVQPASGQAIDWITFENPGTEEAPPSTGVPVSNDLLQLILDLGSSAFDPAATFENPAEYRIQQKRFALSTSVAWSHPDAPPHRLGHRAAPAASTPSYLWSFPDNLQQFLYRYAALAPGLRLYEQHQENLNVQSDPQPLSPAALGTLLNLTVGLIPAQGATSAYTYALQGVDEAGTRQLQYLLNYLKAGTAQELVIDTIQVLYATPKANSSTVVPPGMMSDGVANTELFLLQTNLSTISHPSTRAGLAQSAATNLLGMDAYRFLELLWECSIVRSGGYYFYYRNTQAGTGLPDYLFNKTTTAQLSLLITYKPAVVPQPLADTAFPAPDFLNCLVLEQPVDVSDTVLYLETLSPEAVTPSAFDPIFQEKVATVLPGTLALQLLRPNPNALLYHQLSGTQPVLKQLQELFNLLEYNIAGPAADFAATRPALPLGPTRDEQPDPNPDASLLVPQDVPADWRYHAVVPAYPFAKASVSPPAGLTAKDPYGGTGKTVRLDFNMLDMFGNRLDHQAPTLPESAGWPVLERPLRYTDNLISLAGLPNLAAAYRIEPGLDGAPAKLRLALTFYASRYADANLNGKNQKALSDLEVYKTAFFQWSQPDVVFALSCSLQQGALVPDAPAGPVLTAFLGNIWLLLHELVKEPDSLLAPDNLTASLSADVAANNPLDVFPLTVELAVARTANIDPQFAQVAAVARAASAVPPDIDHASTEGELPPIRRFATELEKAFPGLKAGTGLPAQPEQVKPAHLPLPEGEEPKARPADIWLVRVAATASAPGLYFQLAAGAPNYFAPKPLSVTLLSRPDQRHPNPVRIYPYATGTGINKGLYTTQHFSGVDIENMAQQFLAALDLVLTSSFSVPAWIVDQEGGSAAGHPFQQLLDAKRRIAKAIANTVTSVLTPVLLPGSPEQVQAAEQFEQQLLIQLSSAYTIQTIIQSPVAVQSPYAPDQAPQLFGKAVDAGGGAANASQPDYAFSASKVALPNTGSSYLTWMFDTTRLGEFSSLRIALDYEITALEHDFTSVAGIDNYRGSSWISFINPFVVAGNTASAPLFDLDIPVPLRAYPPAPSLTGQDFAAAVPQFGQQPDPKPLTLEDAEQWSYLFDYNFNAASQDIVYANLQLNYRDPGALFRTAQDDVPDLLEALLQFNAVYPAIAADLNQYLAGPEIDPTNALPALQAFAWLAGRAANAWGLWHENEQRLRSRLQALPKSELNYRISQYENQQKALEVKLEDITTPADRPNSPAPKTYALPAIGIAGYTAAPVEKDGAKFFTYTATEPPHAPLLWNQRNSVPQRRVTLPGLHILAEETAWSGIYVTRNECLQKDPGGNCLGNTNPDFIYRTPIVRFVNVQVPLLDPAGEIALTSLVTPAGQYPLSTYLAAFFGQLPAERSIKMDASYTYPLTEDGLPTDDPLTVTVPVLLFPPYLFKGAPDCDPAKPNSLTAQLAAAINAWVSQQVPAPRQKLGKLVFSFELFSSQSEAKLPILRLRQLTLPLAAITFPS